MYLDFSFNQLWTGSCAGTEIIAKKEEAYRFLEARSRTCHAGPRGKVPGEIRRQKGQGETTAQSLFLVLCRKISGEQNGQI